MLKSATARYFHTDNGYTLDVIVLDDFGDVYGMFYAMTSDGFDYQEMSDYAELVRRAVLDIDGVSSVDVYGERQACINVEFLL